MPNNRNYATDGYETCRLDDPAKIEELFDEIYQYLEGFPPTCEENSQNEVSGQSSYEWRWSQSPPMTTQQKMVFGIGSIVALYLFEKGANLFVDTVFRHAHF